MFEFNHLDSRTRQLMLEEAEMDKMQVTEYYGRRLTAKGVADWPSMLRAAITDGTCETLAADIRSAGRLKTQEERKTMTGVVLVAVPVNAADVLAQGEFNPYYIRAICRRVIDDGGKHVVVCRGRYAEKPRPESQAMIGRSLDAKELYDDIRSHRGAETQSGILLINSGLTVRLPD